MSMLSRICVGLGIGLGLSQSPEIAQTEQQHSAHRTWWSWLVKDKSTASETTSEEPEIAKGLQEKPGQVVVWGGAFGRSPRVIHALGNEAMKVATSETLGVVVDQQGKVRSFSIKNGTDVVEEITTLGRAVDVSLRDSAQELVILDAAGRVSVTQREDNGKFRPAKLLEGSISRSRIAKVQCGKAHCVAITKRGEAFAWGSSNSHGQLATGDIGSSSETENSVPKKIVFPKGSKIVDAACGDRHSLFLGTDGEVYGVGDDHWAQLGISAEPWLKMHADSCGVVRKSELVKGLSGCSIAGGGQHSVMLVRDGTVFSFGFNQWGQLGHHNYSSLAPPSPIADYTIRAIAISAGENHTCIVKNNGELWCIGGNSGGQLGIGTLQPSMVWKKVRLHKQVVKPSFLHSLGNVTAVVVPPDTVTEKTDEP